MTLDELQRQAWDIAEAKGFHDDLRHAAPSLRNRALADLSIVYGAVTDIAQYVKRHGEPRRKSSEGCVLERYVLKAKTALRHFWEDFDTVAPCTMNGKAFAAHVRLILIHTEVDEAAAAMTAESFANELADIAIRLGDLAQEHGIDLTKGIERVMARNAQRPRLYNTPGEEKE